MISLFLSNPFLTLLSMRCVHLHREKKFLSLSFSIYMYGMFSFRREKRRETYTILLLWNKKRTDGGEVFLISRAHDKLLLMSDEEKKKKQFSWSVCV